MMHAGASREGAASKQIKQFVFARDTRAHEEVFLFARSEQQQRLYDEGVQFARARLNAGDEGGVLERDERSEFSHVLWRECAANGALGLFVAPQLGGKGLSVADSVAYLEGLGYGCTDNGLTYAINAQLWSLVNALSRFADDAQKRRYLAKVVSGECIGCYAMTEPESGSDCFALATRAEKTDGGYRLTGTKELITFAPIADFALVFARLGQETGRWGISAFLLDADTPGYTCSAGQTKMGLRTAPIGRIELRDCEVPEGALLGNEGSGASIFSTAQEGERGCILSSQLGAMQRQLDETVAHARKRKQFGQTIGKFQSVSNRIVDMRLRIETGRMMLYKTAALMSANEPAMIEAAMTNLLLAEGGLASSIDAVRVAGGRGYLSEFETERGLRDALGGTLYGGTSDIQRDIIARLMGL